MTGTIVSMFCDNKLLGHVSGVIRKVTYVLRYYGQEL